MKKYIAFVLILLVIAIMTTFQFCVSVSDTKLDVWKTRTPASWGKYKIDSVANEPLLSSVWNTTEPVSGCGLSDNDFIKYAMSKIDYRREFQFIVFTDGKPLVGDRCLKKAFIFYLKESK